MNIVVLAGGLSTERDVSITSGTMVAGALRRRGHRVVLLDVFMGYEKDECDIEALFEQGYDFTENLGVREIIPDLDKIKASRRDKSDRFLGEHVEDICRYADICFMRLESVQTFLRVSSKEDTFCPGSPLIRSTFILSKPASSAMRMQLTKSSYVWILPRLLSSDSCDD